MKNNKDKINMKKSNKKQPKTRIDREKIKEAHHSKPHFAHFKHLDKKTKRIYESYGNGKPHMHPHAATSSIYRFYPSNKLTGTILCILLIIAFIFFCYLSGKTQPRTNPTTNTTQTTSKEATQASKDDSQHISHQFQADLYDLNLPTQEHKKLISIYNSQNSSNKKVILHQIHVYNEEIPNLATRRLTIMNYLNNLKQQLKITKENNSGHSTNGNELH